MATISHNGHNFEVSDEAIEGLANMGSDVASGTMTAKEAVLTVLRAEGYNHEAITQSGSYWRNEARKAEARGDIQDASVCWTHSHFIKY